MPAAAARLGKLGRVLRLSKVYASRAVGPPGQPDFLNAAALIETELSPEELREGMRRIEADLGRLRSADKFAPRPIDLDLILYDNLVTDAATFRIPDPALLERPYLAVTAAEVDPERLHPVTGERLAALAARLASSGGLSLIGDVLLRQACADERPEP